MTFENFYLLRIPLVNGPCLSVALHAWSTLLREREGEGETERKCVCVSVNVCVCLYGRPVVVCGVTRVVHLVEKERGRVGERVSEEEGEIEGGMGRK